MIADTATTPAEPHTIRSELVRFPTWYAVVGSRLLVLCSGIAGALLATRRAGWVIDDPARSTLHLGRVGNVLAGAVDRWDAVHYLEIARHGYVDAGHTPFFPLYPMLIRVLGLALGSDLVAAAAISLAAFGLAATLLYRLASAEFGEGTARATVWLLSLAPAGFIFTAAYTESLFLLLTLGAFTAARGERWRLACVLAALDSIARIPGVIAVVPVAWYWWQSSSRPRWALPWILIVPLPLVAFCCYLDARGFGPLAWMHNEGTSFSRNMYGPPAVIVSALHDGISGIVDTLKGARPVVSSVGSVWSDPFYNVVEMVVLLVSLAALTRCWRRLPRVYAVYATLVLIVALWSATPPNPLRSFDRFVLTIFPLWIAAAGWLRERRALAPVLVLGAAGLCFYAFEFASWAYVA
jgi:hypothetical protein